MEITTAFVLDTSAYSAFQRGDKRLRPFFTQKNTIIIPVIVIGELGAGFATGNREKDNVAKLQSFLDSSNVQTAYLTSTTARLYAAIYARLRAMGTPINTNDMWIAALAFEHDLIVLTLDKDFSRIPDLLVAEL